jgi:hypothetical protein
MGSELNCYPDLEDAYRFSSRSGNYFSFLIWEHPLLTFIYDFLLFKSKSYFIFYIDLFPYFNDDKIAFGYINHNIDYIMR